MGRKRNKNRWPPPLPPDLPAVPKGDDGKPRFVAWVEGAGPCACGVSRWWRDQYLRVHCGGCEPLPPQITPAIRDLDGRRNLWEISPLSPGVQVVQLRLFDLNQ